MHFCYTLLKFILNCNLPNTEPLPCTISLLLMFVLYYIYLLWYTNSVYWTTQSSIYQYEIYSQPDKESRLTEEERSTSWKIFLFQKAVNLYMHLQCNFQLYHCEIYCRSLLDTMYFFVTKENDKDSDPKNSHKGSEDTAKSTSFQDIKDNVLDCHIVNLFFNLVFQGKW